MFRLVSLAVLAAILCAFAGGCGGRENPEITRLNAEIDALQAELDGMNGDLENKRAEQRERRETANLFVDINRTLRAEMNWSGGRPRIEGRQTNETDLSLSGLAVKVTFEYQNRVLREETINVVFPSILAPGEESRFTAETSPSIWGFQPPWEEGHTRLRAVEAMVAGGKILREEQEELWEVEGAIASAEEAVLQKRIEIGRLITRRDELLRD